MQLENHVLVMCIALRQFWGFAGNWPAGQWAVGVLLHSLVGSICVRVPFSHWRAHWRQATEDPQPLGHHSVVGKRRTIIY